MKKLALVMDDEIRNFTATRTNGILQKIKESAADVNLYIFRSSGVTCMDEDYNTGEYNIYHLPDFSDFDGIIVDLNNVTKDERMSSGIKAFDYVIEQIKKSGKPRISIANDIKDFYFAGIDNYSSMKKMIAHLYEVHGCRNFWCVMGPKGNNENQKRAKSLRDYMDEHQIAYDESNFYYESFEYQCGLNGFEELLKKHGELPDAVVCANDNIAIGVCEKARELGYNVPQDFRVTGYDNCDKAPLYSTGISTVNQRGGAAGYKAAEIMFRLWNGETVPRVNYIDTQCIFRGSCGCTTASDRNFKDYIWNQIREDVAYTEYNEQLNALNYELVHCTSIIDICHLITERISIIKDIGLYLVLDEHIYDVAHLSDTPEHLMAEQEQFLTRGYPDSMNLVFAYEDGCVKNTTAMDITSLFPMFDSPISGTDFTFIPLHFGQFTVGYFVIKNGWYLVKNRHLIKIINTLSTAIENFYRKDLLSHANDMLSRLYVRDSMTGLFNRLGYQKKATELFKRCKVLKEDLTILFIDMDRLKYINDNYGHEYGDFALKIIANAIFHNCTEDSIPIRWGGDEFLVIIPLLNPEELNDMTVLLRDEINSNAKKMQLPCPLTVSIGSVNTDMTTDKVLDDYIQIADENMYKEKVKKKAIR